MCWPVKWGSSHRMDVREGRGGGGGHTGLGGPHMAREWKRGRKGRRRAKLGAARGAQHRAVGAFAGARGGSAAAMAAMMFMP